MCQCSVPRVEGLCRAEAAPVPPLLVFIGTAVPTDRHRAKAGVAMSKPAC